MAPNPVKWYTVWVDVARQGNKTSPAIEESDEEECPLAPGKRSRLLALADVDAAVFSCVWADRGPERLSAGSQEAADLCDANTRGYQHPACGRGSSREKSVSVSSTTCYKFSQKLCREGWFFKILFRCGC
eukprot:g41318.t1